jgi:hypothetical protein
MPVVRGQPTIAPLDPDRRRALLGQLQSELRGETTKGGPVIFEIPVELPAKIDVLVVWQGWEGVRSEDRTDLILESYGENAHGIAQALGVTYAEALDQNLLPYSVVPMAKRGEVTDTEVHQQMLQEGGIPLSEDRVDLRFPTMAMAEVAHRRLWDRFPRGYWSIVQHEASAI